MRTHQENRESLCIGCHKRGKTLRKISEIVAPKVRENIFSGYSFGNCSLPCMICDTCSKEVRSDRKVQIFDYDKLTRSMPRGHSQEQCQCYICLKVRSNKNLSYLKSHHKKRGPKSSTLAPPKKLFKVCPKCRQKVGPGIRHHCTPGKKAKNISSLAETRDVKEQTASVLLKGMDSNNNGDISLKQISGRPLRVRMKPKDKKLSVLTHEKLDKFHSKVTRDNKGTDLLAQGLRKVHGRKSVQPYYKDMRREKKKKAESFLEIINLKLQVGRDDERIACVMRNARDFVEHLKIKRKLRDDQAHVRVSADGGGKFLKYGMNLMNKDEQPPASASNDLFEDDFKDSGKKLLS